MKLQLRKTKTDKKDALTIAQFLIREEHCFSPAYPSVLAQGLKDLARRREKLADQVTALKVDIKRILSVTFPELEGITGIFTKSTLRLLMQYPSAHALRQAGPSAIADNIAMSKSRGAKSRASAHMLQQAALTSVGVTSSAKELVLKQEACLLLHVQEQMKEASSVLRSLMTERMKQDMELLCSTKGIGEVSALNFLIEMGGDVGAYENEKKLIAAAGLDPSTDQSGKHIGVSRISKRGNRHLRRIVWIMATKVIINNQIFRAYFFKRRKEGLPYKKAVLATAHKLIRVMFAMLNHRTCFQAEGAN